MKKVMIMLFVFLCIKANSQVYKYYFIEIGPNEDNKIILMSESGAIYRDIDSLLSKKEKKKIVGRVFESYTEVFNKLSIHGLEFVNFANLSTQGGAVGAILGSQPHGYFIWRKKID